MSGFNLGGFDLGDYDLGNMDWANGVQSSTGETWSVPGSTLPMPAGIGDVFSNFSAAPASGLSGLWDNLTGQFKQIGQNVVNNPLGALAAGLGAYGSYKENTGGKIPEGTIDAVDQLMLKSQMENAYTPQPVQGYKNPVARDYRHYIQSYDLDGNASQSSRNDALTNDMYQKVLGRNADTGGLKFWSDNMDQRGMQAHQLERELMLSPEKRIDDIYKEMLGRRPDFGGGNYWQDRMQNGASLDNIKQSIANSPEMLLGHLYREELGRNPDLYGMEHFSEALNKGVSPEEIRMSLRNSAEGKARQPAPAAPAPVQGGLAAANPAPGVPTAVAPRPGKIFPDDGMNDYYAR